MAIKQIENIVIPGYGQYALYSFEYSPGFGESPGVVDVEFLNHTGVYPTQNVGVHSYLPIYVKRENGSQSSLGQFTLVSSEVQESDKYKSLRIRFMDKSIELDRYLVALRGQVGYDTTAYNALPTKEKGRIFGAVSNGGRVIWVGSSSQECKENILGASEGTDPCDPCPEKLSDPLLRQLDCEKYYLNHKRIYRYTFGELLSAVSSATGITMSAVTANTSLKFEYVGSVREVLTNICGELGLAFFYDPTLNQVVFVDVKVGININVKTLESANNKCKVLSKSVKVSRENTKDVWGVASFSRESEERRYGCGLNSCKKLTMQPFTLEDILEDPGHFKQDDSGLAGFKKLEFYSTLNARLGKDFRDLFVWLQEYKFKTPADVEKQLNKKLYKLNGMTIRKVFHANSENFDSKFMYHVLMANITSKNFDAIVENAEKKKTYFFLAEIDEVYEEKINNLEISVARDFLGRFWIRRFKQNWKGLSYQTISPDGSVTYYDFRQPINLPFADMIFEAYGSLKNSPLLDRDGIASGGAPGEMTTQDTFFFMDRPASFWPVSFEDEALKNLEKNNRDYLFKEFAAPVDLANKFKELNGLSNYEPNTFRLFKVDYSADELDFDLNISDEEEHPVEADNVTINVNACGKYTSYGLRSAKTRKFDIKMGDFKTGLYMPVQSYVRNSGDHAGYSILVERNGIDATYIIPKAEVFAANSVPSTSSASVGIDLNFYDATVSDLNLLARSSGENYCDMNLGSIQTLLSGLKSNLSHSFRSSEERSYTLEGFPVDIYTPKDGLKSLNVSAGAGGLRTSITFSNSAPFNLSVNSVLKQLRHTRIAQLSKPFPSGTWNKRISNDLPEIDD